MITNKDEAFHHNSCKKLAQLSKVIFAMNCLKQDQIDEKDILLFQYENSINDITEKHIEELNNIRQLLFKYRKNYINKDCTSFGASYKNIKKDFVDYFNEQTEKFVQILNKINEAQEEIKFYQVSSLQVAANFFEKSDIITNDLNKLEKVELSPALIKKTVNPILTKIELFNKQSIVHFNEIKENYKIKKIQLEKEKKILEKKIFNSSIWRDFSSRLSQLQSEISIYKDEIDLIKQNHSNFFTSQVNFRNQIINETSQNLKILSQQKNALIKTIKKYSSDHDYTVQLLEKDRKNNISRYNQNFNKLQHEIHQTKHDRHQFQKSYSSRGEQLQLKLSNNINILNQQFLSKRNSLLEFQANNRKFLLHGLKDSEKLLSSLSSLIKKSLDNERYNVSRMQIRIQQMQINQNSICDKYKASYQTSVNQQNEKFENCLQKYFSLNDFSTKLIEKVDNLRGLLKSNQEENTKEFASYNNRYKQEYQNAYDNYQKLLKIKKEKSDSIFSQKIERKTQNLNQNQSKLKEEIINNTKTINDKNNAIVNDERNSIRLNMFQFVESQNHQMELNKINGRLEFYTHSIEQAKQVADKTIEQLNHEISIIDKKIRQFKRSVKSSIQNIDQEFEMKIQVLQIDLNNKIENLSKLFTKEENDRGCQIIEALRKIRETENQKLNKSLLLKREKEKMIQKINEQINEKKKEIQNLKNDLKEKEIKDKIKSLKSNLSFLLENENNKLNEEKNQIKDKILHSKSDNSNKLNSILSETEDEKQRFNQYCSDFANKKDEIINKSKDEINKTNEEFEKTVEHMQKMHQKEIDSIKRRIEFAKKIQREEIDKQNNEINQLKQKCNNEVEKIKNLSSFNNNDNRIDKYSEDLFDKKFGQLINRQINLYQLFLLNAEEMEKVQSKRLNLEYQAVKKTDDLSKEFSIHFQSISNCSQNNLYSFSYSKEKKIQFNLAVTNENKDENNNNDIRNQLYKRLSQNLDSNHNGGNITESSSHKKIPTLVTPWLVA